MAKELNAQTYQTSGTVYARLWNATGSYWYTVTPAFEAFNATHITSYALTGTQDGSTGKWTADMPAAVTVGLYYYCFFLQAGGSPAQSDTPVSTVGSIDYTGTVASAAVSYLPQAQAGAANGVLIAGTNAGTTFTSSTGPGLTCSSTGGNGQGALFSGNGAGDGIKAIGGATGDGFHAACGASGAFGILGEGAGSAGIRGICTGGNGPGIEGVGIGTGDGILGTGGATGRGGHFVGGATSGAGLRAEGTAGNSNALELVGQGTGDGLNITSFNDTGTFTVTGATTLTGAVTATNAGNDIRGVTITQAFPANFSSLGITAAGKISEVVLTDSLGSSVTVGGYAAGQDPFTLVMGSAMTESYSTGSVTLPQAMYEMLQVLGQFSISGTTLTVQQRDKVTTAATFNLNDASNPSSRTRAS